MECEQIHKTCKGTEKYDPYRSKNQSAETNTELTQMLELADKGINTVIIPAFYIQKTK